MYESFYGLRERPFDLTPNPRFLLLTGKHREALSNLKYGLESRRGLTLLVGEAGTGKTTVLRTVLQELQGKGALIAYLNNPMLTRTEFYEFVATAFGLDPALAASKTRLLTELESVLTARLEAGNLSGLAIDEAQVVPDELLEEVRLLANIETATHKLLPIVLAGQPELADRLNKLSLRQLKQRVALRCQLPPLDLRETAEYIASRIRVAGGKAMAVFTREAVETIHERSRGIPRLISVICDNALISGFAADRRPVTRDIVEDVCRDFDLTSDEDDDQGGLLDEAPILEKTPVLVPIVAQTGGTPPTETEPVHRGLFEQFRARRRFSFF